MQMQSKYEIRTQSYFHQYDQRIALTCNCRKRFSNDQVNFVLNENNDKVLEDVRSRTIIQRKQSQLRLPLSPIFLQRKPGNETEEYVLVRK